MSERDGYRENLQGILAFTGGKHLLSVNDVRRYTGLTDLRTIKRQFPQFMGAYISAESMAMQMAGGGK